MKKKKKTKTIVWPVRSHPQLKADLKKKAKKNKMSLNKYVCITLAVIAYDGGLPTI